MSQPDPSLGAEELDDEEACEDDASMSADEDGPAPAASLTSIRLTRRRSKAKPQPSAQAQKSRATGRSKTAVPEMPAIERHVETPPRAPDQEAADKTPTDTPNGPSEAQQPGNIVDYWSRLRGERPYPAPAELDPELITATWPNAMLLRRHDGEAGLRAAALYKPEAGPANRNDRTLDFSPMIVEWILSMAEQTVSSGQPIAEKESFERPQGSVRYAACALPLSENQAQVDHVLCYLRVVV